MALWKELAQGKYLLFLDRCEDIVFIDAWEKVKKRTPRNPQIDEIERVYFEEGLGLKEVDLAYANTQLKRIGEPALDFPPTLRSEYTSAIRGVNKAEQRRLIRINGITERVLQWAKAESATLPVGPISESYKGPDAHPIDATSRRLLLETAADVKVRHARELEELRTRHVAEVAAAERRGAQDLARAIQVRLQSADPAKLAEIARQLELA